MNHVEFVNAMDAGGVDLAFDHSGRQTLIKAWRLRDRYILTWEECVDGDQYNESSYTKDIRGTFANASDVIELLEKCGIDVRLFEADSE